MEKIGPLEARIETEYDLKDSSKRVVLRPLRYYDRMDSDGWPTANFDGWPIRNVIARILEMAKPPSKSYETD